MAKSPHTPEFRAKVSQEYLDGFDSYRYLSAKYNIGCKTYHCKTPLEVRKEALSSKKAKEYPIPENKRIDGQGYNSDQRYWNMPGFVYELCYDKNAGE